MQLDSKLVYVYSFRCDTGTRFIVESTHLLAVKDAWDDALRYHALAAILDHYKGTVGNKP